jgi:transcriptional regulator with XRE-family HTH domain
VHAPPSEIWPELGRPTRTPGAKLRRARTEREISLETLASHDPKHRPRFAETIRKLERGIVRYPSADTVEDLAAALSACAIGLDVRRLYEAERHIRWHTEEIPGWIDAIHSSASGAMRSGDGRRLAGLLDGMAAELGELADLLEAARAV